MIEIHVQDMCYLEESEGLERLVLHDAKFKHSDVYYIPETVHDQLKAANGRLTEIINKQDFRIRELEERLSREIALVSDLLDACGDCDELINLNARLKTLEEKLAREET